MANLLQSSSKYEEQASWSDLPLLVLEKIYSFLSRMDRGSMSLVSPNWSHGYESPSLWKSFRFNMTHYTLSKGNTFSLMDCVRKYSRYFKHVNISFERDMKVEEFYGWSKLFITFLQILTNTSEIASIKFVYLGQCFVSLDLLDDHAIIVSICRELDNFFGSQRNLKRLEFYGSKFYQKDGVQILKRSFDSCKNVIETLVLHTFFTSFEDGRNQELNDPCIEQLLPLIFSLPNLSHLEIDYILIFGIKEVTLSEVLEKLKNCRKEMHLKILNDIDYLIFFDDIKFLTSNDWRILKRQYPYLDMELYVDKFSAIQLPLESLILEQMPISKLSYNLGFRDWELSVGMEIHEFLKHINTCKISNDLVSLTLEWSEPIRDLLEVFIPFFKMCQKLKTLVLNIAYPANQLDVFLESLLINKPKSLEKFQLTIWDVEKEQVEHLRNLGSKFEERLKVVNLNFKLLVDEIEPEDLKDSKDQKDRTEEILDSISLNALLFSEL